MVRTAIHRPGLARALQFIAFVTLASWAAVVPDVARADVPANLDIAVNAHTTDEQGTAAVAMLAGGGFAVVWMSHGQDGNDFGIVGRRFDAEGTPAGGEFVVNTYTTGAQRFPRLSPVPSGGFVVVWETDYFGGDFVAARRFDAAAQPVGGEIAVDTTLNTSVALADVGHDGAGNFTVVWHREAIGDPDGKILARRFDAGGGALGTEFQISTYATGRVHSPRVSVGAAGDFTVAWLSGSFQGTAGADGSEVGVMARRYDASAAALGTEFVVNTYTSKAQNSARVERDSAGNLVVAWRSDDSSGSTLRAQRFDASGVPLGSELTLLTGLGVSLDDLLVAPGGGFVLVWTQRDTPFDDAPHMYARRYDAAGAPVGPEMLVTDHLPLRESGDDGAMDAAGNFVAVWSEGGSSSVASRDGSGSGVFARRFCSDSDPTCDVCAGFDDTIDTDADGVADGCDPCTTLGPGQEPTSALVDIRVKDSSIPQRANRIVVNADFTPAGGPGVFGTLAPDATGMRIRVEAASGASIIDTKLAPGAFAGSGTAGWRGNSSGTKWIHLDKRVVSPNADIFKLTLRDLSGGFVRLRARGKGGNYDASTLFIPLTASIALGDEAYAGAGICGEVSFAAAECNGSNFSPAAQLRCAR